MLGWNYNDSVEFGNLPDVDTSSVSTINVTSDIQTAITNNYSIKITERRLANSQSENNRATYTNTLTNQKDTVSTNVKNAYNSLVLAKDSYEQAKTSYELAEKERAAAELKALRRNHHKEDIREAGIRLPFCENFHGIREVKLSHCKDQL